MKESSIDEVRSQSRSYFYFRFGFVGVVYFDDYFLGGDSTLRFTTTRPIDTVIYSADFMIMPSMNTMTTTTTTTMTERVSGSGALATQTQAQSETTAGDGSFAFTTVPATTGSTLSFDCTSTAGPLIPSGIPPPGQAQGQGQQRAASAGRRSASVDVGKLKFRFVFVIWPVLMGITMAL